MFLDLFDHEGAPFDGPLHPHSGIATLTYVLEGAVSFIDPDNVKGTLPAGGIEWMQAGRGMWHSGRLGKAGPPPGFQLWMALPPAGDAGGESGARPPGQLRLRIERPRVPLADQLPRGTPEVRGAPALRPADAAFVVHRWGVQSYARRNTTPV